MRQILTVNLKTGERKMKDLCKKQFKMLIGFFLLALCVPSGVSATPLTINPTDDGSIYSSGSVSTGSYLMASGGIQAVVEFSTDEITDPISQALLSVNPYALPLWGSTVYVFGYDSYDGILTSADYDSGMLLGEWEMPSLGYGEDTYFDVTSFMITSTSPFVGFNLRTDSGGTDVFSSIEYNYGHPAQLIVNPVPEPATMLLFASGLTILAGSRIRRK